MSGWVRVKGSEVTEVKRDQGVIVSGWEGIQMINGRRECSEGND